MYSCITNTLSYVSNPSTISTSTTCLHSVIIIIITLTPVLPCPHKHYFPATYIEIESKLVSVDWSCLDYHHIQYIGVYIHVLYIL